MHDLYRLILLYSGRSRRIEKRKTFFQLRLFDHLCRSYLLRRLVCMHNSDTCDCFKSEVEPNVRVERVAQSLSPIVEINGEEVDGLVTPASFEGEAGT